MRKRVSFCLDRSLKSPFLYFVNTRYKLRTLMGRGSAPGLSQGGLQRSGMVAKCGYFNLHKGVKRQRVQYLVKFRRIVHIKDAEIGKLARHAPEMQPLALLLQFLRAFMLRRTELFDPLWIGVKRNVDVYKYMEQHACPPSSIREIVAMQFDRPTPEFGRPSDAARQARIPMPIVGFDPSPVCRR